MGVGTSSFSHYVVESLISPGLASTFVIFSLKSIYANLGP